MKITKEWLEQNNACTDGVDWFEKQNQTDARKLMILAAVSGNGEYSQWGINQLLRGDKTKAVKVAIFAAELVLDRFEQEYPNDNRPRKAIDAAKDYIKSGKEPADGAYVAFAAAAAASHTAYDAAAFNAAAEYAAAAYAAAAYAAAASTAASDAAYAAVNAAANATAYAANATAYAANAANNRIATQIKIINYVCEV